MPRDIPVGNGSLLICFDREYAIRDLYFPHVGQEDHLGGATCRFGVFVDGKFSWVGSDWKKELLYCKDTLVAETTLHHPELQLLLVCRDTVDFHENIYLREAAVENLSIDDREIRLFFCQDFSISGNNVGDTAFYDPDSGGIIHYKGSRYFLANIQCENGCRPIEFAVGKKGTPGSEGTFRDCEDGSLSGNTVAQGSIDSALGASLAIDGLSIKTAYYWIAAAESRAEVKKLDALVKYKTPQALIRRTHDYWNLWVKKESPPLDGLSEKATDLYRRSLLVLNTQIDSGGAILAANDSDVIQFNRDTYSYMWPRDGAIAANALDLAGYPVISQNFFKFAAKAIEKEGYLLHKYNPDGTPASSWHPWFENGEVQLPIQEDETALVLWALWHHFVIYRDIEFIKPLYKQLVKNGADFLCGYIDVDGRIDIVHFHRIPSVGFHGFFRGCTELPS